MTKRSKSLSPAEASRALYIDFEGEKDRAPVLLGCARWPGKGDPPWVWQAVTAESFRPMAFDESLEYLPLPDAVERIIQRAESNDCRVVAWSEHELKVVGAYCPEHLERFQTRFVNARSLAERWRNRCHDGRKPSTNQLPAYLQLIGHNLPPGAEAGKAGNTIRLIASALGKGRGFDGLTANQRQRWADLREHNRHDCAGMRKVCQKAAREIAASDVKPR